jgi:hypothetical protein
MHTLQKLSSPTNRRAIFGFNIRINSIVPAIDGAMAPNSPTTLRKSINPSHTPSPRCTMPPRNKVDDEGDVHRSAPKIKYGFLINKICGCSKKIWNLGHVSHGDHWN